MMKSVLAAFVLAFLLTGAPVLAVDATPDLSPPTPPKPPPAKTQTICFVSTCLLKPKPQPHVEAACPKGFTPQTFDQWLAEGLLSRSCQCCSPPQIVTPK